MGMRVLIGQLEQEAATFNPAPTGITILSTKHLTQTFAAVLACRQQRSYDICEPCRGICFRALGATRGRVTQLQCMLDTVRAVYEMFSVSRGEELLARYAGTRTQLAAAIDLLGEQRTDIELVPCYAAESVSGVPLCAGRRACWPLQQVWAVKVHACPAVGSWGRWTAPSGDHRAAAWRAAGRATGGG